MSKTSIKDSPWIKLGPRDAKVNITRFISSESLHYSRGSQICDAISIIQFCSVIVEDGIVDSGGTKGHAERWSERFLEDGIHKLKLEMQEGVYQGGVEGHRKVINQHGLLKAL